MENQPKIIAFAGSSRKESFNKKLVKIAVEIAKKAGAQVTLIDLGDYPMPLMDQDLEVKEGMPANGRKVKELMISHDAFLISSPEYNSSIPPLLKNTFDWASRTTEKNETPLLAYKGKVAGLLSASPGGLGGIRSLVTVRSILENIGVLVIPHQHCLSKAHEAFDAEGKLKDPKQQESVEKVVNELVRVIKKLKT